MLSDELPCSFPLVFILVFNSHLSQRMPFVQRGVRCLQHSTNSLHCSGTAIHSYSRTLQSEVSNIVFLFAGVQMEDIVIRFIDTVYTAPESSAITQQTFDTTLLYDSSEGANSGAATVSDPSWSTLASFTAAVPMNDVMIDDGCVKVILPKSHSCAPQRA